MADEDVLALLRQSAISFIGTVEMLGASTMPDLPVDERTAVVVVDQVLHTPAAFTNLAGTRVTVQLDPAVDLPPVGTRLALFANAMAFGDSLAVREVGRLSPQEVEPQGQGFAAGDPPVTRLQDQLERARAQDHAAEVAAVVVARVTGLRKAGTPATREHDPDWWWADLEVYHVERGPVSEGALSVLYANSLDVRWRAKPKPKASQDGLWFLHATEGSLAELGPYYLMDGDDFAPVQSIDALQADGQERAGDQ
ncbi:MAG TPA: hypothetical protein VLL08_10775 [Kineosporiaceae bacterium]|nr:hypothetical protein [Kineosporiaceae bacterium]